jgi:hypothetical protein
MPNCLCCGKSLEISDGQISDGCCSDACWESYFAPGPKEEAELELDRIEIYA